MRTSSTSRPLARAALVVCLLLPLLGAEGVSRVDAAPRKIGTAKMWLLASKGRFRRTLAVSQWRERARDKMPPDYSYLVGLSLVRIHQFQEALPFLEHARALRYRAVRGWKSVVYLRDRARTFLEKRPPLLASFPKGAEEPLVRVYGPEHEWVREITKIVPRMLREARRVFPDRLPQTDFFLFPEHASYEAFFRVLYGDNTTPRPHQHGAGRVGAVVLCLEDREGKDHANRVRLEGDLLHEYGHALCEERFGDLYLSKVPNWLNEGMADAIARNWSQPLYKSSPGAVRDLHAKKKVPTYLEMRAHLYASEPWERYSLARLMVDAMLGDRGDRELGPLLDEARRTQDFEGTFFRRFRKFGPGILQDVLAAHRPKADE